MENAPNAPLAGEMAEGPDLFSLVDFRFFEGEEGPRHHRDPVVEFYNKCHGDDGRFCEGGEGGVLSGHLLATDHDFMPEYEGDYKKGLEVGSQEWYDDNKRVNQEAWWDFTEAEEASYADDTNTFFKKGPLREAHKNKSLEEAAAFKDYQKEGYSEVNQYLNNNLPRVIKDLVYDEEHGWHHTYEDSPRPFSEQGKKTLAGMDTAFSTKGVNPGRGLFFRGVTNNEEFGEPVDLSKYTPGTVVTNDGFVSTSTSKDVAFYSSTKLAPDDKNALIRIRTTGDSDASTHLGKQTEKEVIFNRGTSFYIRNQYKDRDGRNVIDAETV